MRTKVVTDIKKIEKTINIPTSRWPGSCMAVASACYEHRLVPKSSKVCYGSYHGKIHKKSLFAGRDFTHHAWIELPDFTIYDPTRWVFLMIKPEVWIGPGRHPDYDLGTCWLMESIPPPSPVESPLFQMTSEQLALVNKFFPSVNPDGLDFAQWHWLGHRHPDKLGASAKVIYKMMLRNGLSGIIPIDLKRYVLGVDYERYRSKSGNLQVSGAGRRPEAPV